MECFVIFVMAWCWLNATESKPQNVTCKHNETDRIKNIDHFSLDNFDWLQQQDQRKNRKYDTNRKTEIYLDRKICF